MKTLSNKFNFWLITLLIGTMILLFSPSSVLAQSEDPPDDPGVADDQDELVTQTIRWVLPHGDTFTIGDEEFDIVLDYSQLIISEEEVGNGGVTFLGIGDINSDGIVDTSDLTCGNGNGMGNCNGNENGNNGDGNNGNGNNGNSNPHHGACGNVWVTPGVISMSSKVSGPSFPVVIGQDPGDEGISIEYTVVIDPTIVRYGKWQIIGHHFSACVQGNSSSGDEDYSDEYSCPNGWHPIIEHIWGCSVREKSYREDFSSLQAGISLTAVSRTWILGELAMAYPNANLIQPSIFYNVSDNCQWMEDACVLNFTFNYQAADPGYYDMIVQGLSSGTNASPPRSFEIKSGKAGVFFIDSTIFN
jgi:hypothetical protein